MCRPSFSFAISVKKTDTVVAHINRPHYKDSKLPTAEYHIEDRQLVYLLMHGTGNAAGWAFKSSGSDGILIFL